MQVVWHNAFKEALTFAGGLSSGVANREGGLAKLEVGKVHVGCVGPQLRDMSSLSLSPSSPLILQCMAIKFGVAL